MANTVGKYHERFAGLLWVIEFKYCSNAELRRLNTTIETFTLRPDDSKQIAGYIEGLQREYPEAQIASFVIYCFSNRGFHLFSV